MNGKDEGDRAESTAMADGQKSGNGDDESLGLGFMRLEFNEGDDEGWFSRGLFNNNNKLLLFFFHSSLFPN